jgi:ABC-type multidrug transport system fused ATPase/permease subunit
MFKVFKTYYSFFWHYKWRFILFIFCLVGLGITNNIQPYFYKLFIEAIPEANQKTIIYVLLGYFGVQVLALIFNNLTYMTGDWVLFPAGRDAR